MIHHESQRIILRAPFVEISSGTSAEETTVSSSMNTKKRNITTALTAVYRMLSSSATTSKIGVTAIVANANLFIALKRRKRSSRIPATCRHTPEIRPLRRSSHQTCQPCLGIDPFAKISSTIPVEGLSASFDISRNNNSTLNSDGVSQEQHRTTHSETRTS